jgi:hypothetical protein
MRGWPGFALGTVAAGFIGAAAAVSGAAAEPKPAAELVFREAAPEAVAPRLASECTRRRMALIRNTPERVVCKQRSAAKAGAGQTVNEQWSFELVCLSRGRTKGKAHRSFEVAGAHGYATLSFHEHSREAGAAMRGFMEEVRDRHASAADPAN